jgi:dihydroorotate dehydrogenase (fumarate)
MSLLYSLKLTFTLTLTYLTFELDISPDTVSALMKFGKPYIVSLSGLSLEDNMEMLDRVLKVPEIASIEINLACPNIPNKPIIAYDYEQLETVLKAFTSHKLFKTKPIGVKLAPYFDTFHYERVISIIAKFDIKYIVTMNTIGNGLFVDWDSESTVIAAKGGFGGIGGKPTRNQCILCLH